MLEFDKMALKIHDNHIMSIYYNGKSAGRFQYPKKILQKPPGADVAPKLEAGIARTY